MNSHTNQIIKKAINLSGGTQAALAKKAGVSQNTIWKLLTGATKKPTYQTSRLLESAVDGRISCIEFLESKAEPNPSSKTNSDFEAA